MEHFYASAGNRTTAAMGQAQARTRPLTSLLALVKEKPVFYNSVAALVKVTDAAAFLFLTIFTQSLLKCFCIEDVGRPAQRPPEWFSHQQGNHSLPLAASGWRLNHFSTAAGGTFTEHAACFCLTS
ncbi:hypothetical protein ILYODFUR_004554 [Ilyodon furcidens]|uniref:Uncharacterized protein n=1 Tax=Ilyodon furcidens TaxID=33524 RepID=A0ABV0SIU1_9TELE